MFSIGEFSKITGLSIKTLRFYHERELLVPARVEAGSGYRSYDERNLDAARAIVALRDFGFGLDEITEILRDHADEADILQFFERRKKELAARIALDRKLITSLDSLIRCEAEARQAPPGSFEEKTLPDQLVAGIRMQGKYESCGQGFAKLGRSLGRHISGPPFCMFYDDEYRDDDANFEPCMPVRKQFSVEGLHIRTLAGGRCLSLIHRGPYPELGRTYERLLRHAKTRGYKLQLPCREIYLKGPGMIFKGNPQNYLTEVQVLYES